MDFFSSESSNNGKAEIERERENHLFPLGSYPLQFNILSVKSSPYPVKHIQQVRREVKVI